MRNDEWVAEHWRCVGTRVTEVRQRLRSGNQRDEAEVRAEIANILHAATSLFELEVRRMARRGPFG